MIARRATAATERPVVQLRRCDPLAGDGTDTVDASATGRSGIDVGAVDFAAVGGEMANGADSSPALLRS